MSRYKHNGWIIEEDIHHEYDFSWTGYVPLRPGETLRSTLRPGFRSLEEAQQWIDDKTTGRDERRKAKADELGIENPSYGTDAWVLMEALLKLEDSRRNKKPASKVGVG